jgi:hypothetical protein
LDQTAIALLLDEETNFRFRLAGAKPVPARRMEVFAWLAKFVMNRAGVMGAAYLTDRLASNAGAQKSQQPHFRNLLLLFLPLLLPVEKENEQENEKEHPAPLRNRLGKFAVPGILAILPFRPHLIP